MSNPKIRYGSSSYTFDTIVRPNYPNNSGIQYYSDIFQNPEYCITNRDLPTNEVNWEVSGIQKTARDLIWTLWNTTLNRGNYLFTLIDHKKRFLFDVFWPTWKERWQKQRGGIYTESLEMQSAYPWTPPMFAFYPFTAANASGYGCHSLDTTSTLAVGSGGSISSQTLTLTEQVAAAVAASKTGLSWYQQKGNSSISLIAKFRCGELNAGAEVDIIKITDGNNILRLYITNVDSSSSIGLSSSEGLSSGGLSSSVGLSSSSSVGLSSSLGFSSSSIHASVSSSSSMGLSSSSMNLSSSSMDLSSSSMNLSSSSMDLSSSSSVGLSSSSSAGLSSSEAYSSSQGLSSVGSSYSSASTSSASVSSSSSIGLSSSSSDAAYSSSSEESSPQMTIKFEWTKSGYSAEYVSQEDINIKSEGVRAWYDVCGTFDNINNRFHLYICRSGDTSKAWSHTFTFLYGTTTTPGTPENSIVSYLTPTNYPEDVTWSAVYLLNGSVANIYVDNNEKAELKYAMIVDDFVPPTEFNWMRRLFHYWNKSGATYPL